MDWWLGGRGPRRRHVLPHLRQTAPTNGLIWGCSGGYKPHLSGRLFLGFEVLQEPLYRCANFRSSEVAGRPQLRTPGSQLRAVLIKLSNETHRPSSDLAIAQQKTIGADKNYDSKGFVNEMRRLGVTLHGPPRTTLAQAAQQLMAAPAATTTPIDGERNCQNASSGAVPARCEICRAAYWLFLCESAHSDYPCHAE